jgi:hypothetical protein
MARAAKRAEPEPEADMTVYEEMLDAAKQVDRTIKEGKNDQDYLKTLIVALADVPDDVFNQMSDEAQEWFNEATDAVNDHNPIPLPDGYTPMKAAGGGRRKLAAAEPEGEAEADPAEEEAPRRSRRAAAPAEEEAAPARRSRRAAPEEEQEEARPAARRGARGAEAAPARKAANGTSRPAAGAEKVSGRAQKGKPFGERGPSMVVEIRKIVVKRPNATIDQIQAALAKKNMEPNEATIRVTKQATIATMDALRDIGWQEPA